MTVPRELFGDVAQWLVLNRGALTIFAHAKPATTSPTTRSTSSGSAQAKRSTCRSSLKRSGCGRRPGRRSPSTSWRVRSPTSKFHGPAERTGVTSTAVPVRNICSKVSSSSGQIARSTTSMPRLRARSMIVRRVIPSRKQSGVGVCSVPSRDEEDIGAGRFGDPAAPVEHQGVVEAPLFGVLLRQGADHVQPRSLRRGRRGVGRGPAPRRRCRGECRSRTRADRNICPSPTPRWRGAAWWFPARPPSIPRRARRPDACRRR